MPLDLFLERCGQFFFSRMRPPFFFALILLPVIVAFLFVFSENSRVQELEERFARAARKEKVSFERKARKDRFLQRYAQADPYFLDQQIESFPLLQVEKERLQSLLHHPAFPESQSLKERLQFLNENHLSFAEENIRTEAQIKEMDENQRYPVQMDEHDLQKILSLIEDVPIDSYLPLTTSPQILIKEIRLKKRETKLQTQVFEVDMDLLKREFSKQ